jgi:hypothetical protein
MPAAPQTAVGEYLEATASGSVYVYSAGRRQPKPSEVVQPNATTAHCMQPPMQIELLLCAAEVKQVVV